MTTDVDELSSDAQQKLSDSQQKLADFQQKTSDDLLMFARRVALEALVVDSEGSRHNMERAGCLCILPVRA